jgi:predicted O-methyltransferase YrrM
MGVSGWLHYPAAWWRRRKGITPEWPWFVPAANGWLRRRIRSHWSILELGSGRSTIWFARRAERVVSFEDNEFWHERTARRLAELGIDNVDLRLGPVDELPRQVEALPDEAFDLLVVDFLESPETTRIDALRPARSKVRSRGHLVLDDSDRPSYAEAYELLAGWRERRFAGIKDDWPEACETSIFTKPRK